jgi:hypothetical protein
LQGKSKTIEKFKNELKYGEVRKFSTKKREMENGSGTIFLHPFTVFSSCNRKFVVCPFVNEETNGSYPFANRLNGLNGLARLCSMCKGNSIFVEALEPIPLTSAFRNLTETRPTST